MEQETAVWIKEEESDVVHNEPGPVGHIVAAMEQETAMLIKEEETGVVHNEPGPVGHTMAATEQETAVWIKEEEADMELNEPGSVRHTMAATEQETAVWIKEEETDVMLNEPGSVGHIMAATEQITAVWIKEEETDRMLNESGSEVLQDPLKIEDISHHVKQDVELKQDADDSEQKVQVYPSSVNIKEEMGEGVNQEFLQDPLKIEENRLHLKQDVELKQDADDSEQKVQVYPSSMNIKEEMGDGVNQEFLEDPLHIEDHGLHIKQDPELDLDVDGPEHNFVQSPLGITWVTDFIKEIPKRVSEIAETENVVVASRSYASNSTRLLQSNERCDFPVEENVSQGVSHNELELGSEESTHFIMFREGEEEEKEESLSPHRLKCSLRENKCQTFFCSFCLQSFTSKYRLMMHVFVHIDGVEPPKSVCKSCGEVFPSYVSLKKHLEISEPEQDSSADNEGKKTKRDICGKSFTRSSHLKQHALIHTETKPHKCDICGKCFTLLSQLRQHTLIHTGTKSQQCDNCGKSFTHLSTLKQHALIHTGTRPHKCDICGKSFTHLSTLKRHVLIHTGTRAHKCDICGKSFTRSSHLKQHAVIHTGSKPHKCDTCGISVARLGTLKRHLLLHTGT